MFPKRVTLRYSITNYKYIHIMKNFLSVTNVKQHKATKLLGIYKISGDIFTFQCRATEFSKDN